jgi:hypothetical protein
MEAKPLLGTFDLTVGRLPMVLLSATLAYVPQLGESLPIQAMSPRLRASFIDLGATESYDMEEAGDCP